MPRKSRGGNLGRLSKKARKQRERRMGETEEEKEERLLAQRIKSKELRDTNRVADAIEHQFPSTSNIPHTSRPLSQNYLDPQSAYTESDSSQPLPSHRQPMAHRVPASHKIARNFDPENPPCQFSLGQMTQVCSFCSALSFPGEKINCCHNGKVHIDLPPFPEQLEKLFSDDTDEAINFRRHIRKYNNSFSFASIQDNRKDAPPGFIRSVGKCIPTLLVSFPTTNRPPFLISYTSILRQKQMIFVYRTTTQTAALQQ